jgi:hypothetical protein
MGAVGAASDGAFRFFADRRSDRLNDAFGVSLGFGAFRHFRFGEAEIGERGIENERQEVNLPRNRELSAAMYMRFAGMAFFVVMDLFD